METNDDDEDPNNIFPQLLLVLILTIINAFFAMSEMAVLTANKTKIDIAAKNGNKKAKLVQALNENQTNFLSTIQVGITLAGFFSSATASVGLSELLGNFLANYNIPYSNTISVVLITVLLSFFTLIFGELFPKKVALAFPEKLAMMVAKPINVIRILTIPFVKLLSGTCNLLAKITGLNKVLNNDKISKEEIISVVDTGVEDGVLDEEKQKMILSVLKFNNLSAKDIMTPRINVYMLNVDCNLENELDEIFENKYSRIPVYQDNKDNIIGIVNIKDLTEAIIKKGIKNIKLTDVMREATFNRDLIKINKLFDQMKTTKNHISILVNEFGETSGIVTMEDIVEEILGSIDDEYDDEINISKISETEYLINGSTPIQEINRELGTSFDEANPDYDTIAGLIISQLNFVPKGEEIIVFNNFQLIVEKVEQHRIIKVKLQFK